MPELNMMLDFFKEGWTFVHTHVVLLAKIFLVLGLGFAVHLLLRALIDRMTRHSEKHHRWDSQLWPALKLPMVLTIWGIVASVLLQMILATFPNLLEEHMFVDVPTVRSLLILLLIGGFLLQVISALENYWVRKERLVRLLDKTAVQGLARMARVVAVALTLLGLLQTLGVDVTGFLTFGAAGTVILGIASRDILANAFSGMIIHVDRPFAVGDWITTPDGSIEGTVEDIGWRLTRIRTFDKRPQYVPNSLFSSISVINPSRMTHRRIRSVFAVRHQDADVLAAILHDVKKMLMQHPDIDNAQSIMVNFTDFGASSLDCMLYCFTRTIIWAEFMDIRQDVFLKTIEIVRQHGADIAHPIQSIALKQSPPERQHMEAVTQAHSG